MKKRYILQCNGWEKEIISSIQSNTRSAKLELETIVRVKSAVHSKQRRLENVRRQQITIEHDTRWKLWSPLFPELFRDWSAWDAGRSSSICNVDSRLNANVPIEISGRVANYACFYFYFFIFFSLFLFLFL